MTHDSGGRVELADIRPPVLLKPLNVPFQETELIHQASDVFILISLETASCQQSAVMGCKCRPAAGMNPVQAWPKRRGI